LKNGERKGVKEEGKLNSLLSRDKGGGEGGTSSFLLGSRYGALDIKRSNCGNGEEEIGIE
jgi:hypothetical protein